MSGKPTNISMPGCVTAFARVILLVLCFGASCAPPIASPDIETQVSFLNLSKTQYVVFGIRAHGDAGDFVYSSLLAPGGIERSRFTTLIGDRCPGSIDLRVLHYRRVHRDVPIGLDPGETLEPTPIAAAEWYALPACDVESLETYTIVNWDAPEGTARVKVAQCSSVDQALQASGRVSASGALEATGVAAGLETITPPPHPLPAPLAGRVTLADGTGVPDVIVLVRTRYRTALDCANAADPATGGYSDPIVFVTTDAQGHFTIPRPAGTYRLEFYSDAVAFRPGLLEVETPRAEISVLAEPLQ